MYAVMCINDHVIFNFTELVLKAACLFSLMSALSVHKDIIHGLNGDCFYRNIFRIGFIYKRMTLMMRMTTDKAF